MHEVNIHSLHILNISLCVGKCLRMFFVRTQPHSARKCVSACSDVRLFRVAVGTLIVQYEHMVEGLYNNL